MSESWYARQLLFTAVAVMKAELMVARNCVQAGREVAAIVALQLS